ncbi:serine/threonine-protein kinase, partial [Acidobacteria bacterium AH-259-A15]|nr:serine/threonine-protein kinase [Acidobacteria bacterium AH-259-A15]
VYRATDTKLDRDVALKVLPEAFASDQQRMARFSREAKVLASLNHPNIASIYGLEESDGKQALVLELVEGETLAERIQKGAIPLEESLKIALQITEALEAAHEKGVIHRDLKPANVKITPEGVVKVLDFGLAKALEGEAPPEDIHDSPTISQMATKAGIILGTAAYMSPEQAKGKPVEKRTDIWAFGAVLYEMLAGKQAFDAEDISQILAKVLEREPQWDDLPKNVPSPIRQLLDRSLTKDIRNRLQAIGEARITVEKYLADPSAYEVGVMATPRLALWRRAISWSFAAVMVVIVAVLSWSDSLVRSPGSMTPRRLTIQLAEGVRLPRGRGPAVVISPDGETLVYVGESATGRQLYRRDLTQFASTPIPGTDGALGPAISPDGNAVVFFEPVSEGLKRVSLSGGEPFPVCRACESGFWADDGHIYFTRDELVWRVPELGGAEEVVFEPMPDRGYARCKALWFFPAAEPCSSNAA